MFGTLGLADVVPPLPTEIVVEYPFISNTPSCQSAVAILPLTVIVLAPDLDDVTCQIAVFSDPEELPGFVEDTSRIHELLPVSLMTNGVFPFCVAAATSMFPEATFAV